MSPETHTGLLEQLGSHNSHNPSSFTKPEEVLQLFAQVVCAPREAVVAQDSPESNINPVE
eukprot:854882-Lingulodinium_polyedra.AAC.1